MGRWIGPLSAVALMLAGASAHAQDLRPTQEQIETYRFSSGVFGQERAGEQLVRWSRALDGVLKARPDTRLAASRLAPAYGLNPTDMGELIGLWVVASDSRDLSEADVVRFHQQFIALATRTGSPFVQDAAAVALATVGSCRTGELARLTEGASDPVAVAWRLARIGDCPVWLGDFATLHPQRATVALLKLRDYAPGPAEALAMHAELTREAALAQVAEADRLYVSAVLYRDYVQHLFADGLTDRAVAVIERLPPELRREVLKPPPARGETHERIVTVSGLPTSFSTRDEMTNIALDLAGAYALAGRAAEAIAILDAQDGVAKERLYMDCALAAHSDLRAPRCPTGAPGLPDPRGMILDYVLHRPGDDPYPIAETYLSGDMGVGLNGGVWAALTCRLLSEPQYQDICRRAQEATVYAATNDGAAQEPEPDAAFRAATAAAALPDYEAQRAAFRQALDQVAHQNGGVKPDDQTYRTRRAEQHPAPSRFAELPLPEAYRGKAPDKAPAWVKTLKPLPVGYQPVRIDRDGRRVAVISVSQNYDPTGEVSSGGYWVHLSTDGGRSWGRPLYTGLAELYPYRVPSASKMPLFDGESLNVAVEIREIDPTSITYPPVGLRSRRQADGLYLRIPLAELTRDSDGDGLTDIAKQHLLLTPKIPGARTPFIVGAGPPSAACSPAEATLQSLLGAFVSRLFSGGTGAIIQPIDRPAGNPLGDVMAAVGVGKIDPNSADRPIFIEGDPADFRCIRSDRLMIVYSPDDLVRLGQFSPDFHAAALGKVVWSRAHDRGYVSWSTGWSGGVVRFRQDKDRWRIEQIGSWIS